MNSKTLYFQLVKKMSAYRVSQVTGIPESKLSNVKHGREAFTADQLAELIEAGLISKRTATRVNFYDNLKNKEFFRYVASVAVFVPVLEVLKELCILCQIGNLDPTAAES